MAEKAAAARPGRANPVSSHHLRRRPRPNNQLKVLYGFKNVKQMNPISVLEAANASLRSLARR